jgi:alpha 1,2-mannosyltransferase
MIGNAEEIQTSIQEAHGRFVAAVKQQKARTYCGGTKDIISSAGGEYMPNLVASLRMIQRTSCRLAVEVS